MVLGPKDDRTCCGGRVRRVKVLVCGGEKRSDHIPMLTVLIFHSTCCVAETEALSNSLLFLLLMTSETSASHV